MGEIVGVLSSMCVCVRQPLIEAVDVTVDEATARPCSIEGKYCRYVTQFQKIAVTI